MNTFQRMNIALPDGTILGKIVHAFGCCYIPFYNVYNSAGKHILRIRGETCSDCCCCQSETFHVSNTQGKEVGSIIRNWDGHQISLLVSDAGMVTQYL